MALVENFCLIYSGDCEVHQFQDKINWGSPEEDRSQGADILLAFHVTDKSVEENVAVDSKPYLSKLIYDINNTLDGHYRYELLRVPIYFNSTSYVKEIKDSNSVTTTYPSIVYYSTTDSFYKAIEDNVGIAPDDPTGTTYWEPFTAFTTDIFRANTTLRVYVYNAIYDCRSRKCVRKALTDLGCGCDDLKAFQSVYKKQALLMGARALTDNGDYNKAETNIRVLANLCPKC